MGRCLECDLAVGLAYTSVRNVHDRGPPMRVKGYALEPVQVMHWQCQEQRTLRDRSTTDEVERISRSQLRRRAMVVGTGLVASE